VRPAGSCSAYAPLSGTAARKRVEEGSSGRSLRARAGSGGRGVRAKRLLQQLGVTRVPRCGQRQFRERHTSSGGCRKRVRAQAAVALQHRTGSAEEGLSWRLRGWKRPVAHLDCRAGHHPCCSSPIHEGAALAEEHCSRFPKFFPALLFANTSKQSQSPAPVAAP
jgi:hypothetical protein